ncbi:MAG: PGF-pre-PGF domain-containing protein [archaeon]
MQRPQTHKIKHREYKARSRIVAFIALIFALALAIVFLNAQFAVPTGMAYDITKCGNGVIEPSNGEECEPTLNDTCPGRCRSDCVCSRCGNNALDWGEDCDGIWDMACPGHCDASCNCPSSESRISTTLYRQAFSYDVLKVNETAVLISNYGQLALSSITVKSSAKLENVKLYIDTNATKTPGIGAPARYVYQYYIIGTQNATQLAYFTAQHVFKVPKTWFTVNNLSESSVKLNRYRGGSWKALPTNLTSGDSNYGYYAMSAEGYGMSLFAISAEELPAQPVAAVAAGAVPVAASAVCGNGVLEVGETSKNCCADAGCVNANESCVDDKCTFVPRCGNGVCEPGESVRSCILDCAVSVKFLPPTLAIFVTIAIIAAFVISFAAIGRHGEHRSGKKQGTEHVVQNLGPDKAHLEEYIKEHLGKGFTEREIERELLKAGWERDLVDKVVFETRSKIEHTRAEKKDKEKGH